MNTDIRATSMRSNKLMTLILKFFEPLYSYSRLVLELFIRRNMGWRYFSWPAVYTLAAILVILPMAFYKIVEFQMSFFDHYINQARLDAFKVRYILWYPFVGVFLVMAFIRSREIKKAEIMYPNRSTKYAGDTYITVLLIKFNIKASSRMIETFYEPAFFFIIGFVLVLFNQSLGTLIMFASFFYRLSYVQAYVKGDHFIADRKDAGQGGVDVIQEMYGDMETSPNGRQKFHSTKPNVSVPIISNNNDSPSQNDEPMVAQ